MRRTMLLLATLGLFTSCSLFGPNPDKITKWLTIPEPGSIYTYTITTTWHDGSLSIEDRAYLIERVEEVLNTITIKFADAAHLTSFYWIVSEDANAVFESTDGVVDDADLMILTGPVEEGTRWSSGAGADEIDYEIERVRSSDTTEVGEVDNLVEVVCSYDSDPSVDITLEWSPDFGLLRYEEDHGTASSYIDQYERELTTVTHPPAAATATMPEATRAPRQ